MTYYRAIPLALLSVTLSACASTQIRYYTLTPPLSDTDAAAPACCKLQIRRVAIPPEVDRTEIVTRSGQDQVVIHANDAWLAPLGEEIRSALGGDINRRLSKETPLASGSPVQHFALWVDITRFDSVYAHYVAVTADWRIQTQTPNAPKTALPPVTQCSTTVRINVAEGMPALVQGYQQAIGQLADHIALALKSADGDGLPRCNVG